jgi:hypothetical protein
MRKIFCFTAALLIAGSALAAGEVWRWKDSNGTWHYSDQPQAGAELVRRSGGRSTTESPSAAAPAAPQPAPNNSLPQTVTEDAANQMRKEVAASQGDQCKKATETYQKAITARVFPKSKDPATGQQTFMSNAEIDAFRLQALNTRNIACGTGT